MAMYAICNRDIVIGFSTSPYSGPEVPMQYINLPIERLRYNGSQIIDIINYTTFYIDENGNKHILKFEDNWTQLSCSYDSLLIQKNGTWVVASDEDVLKLVQEDAINFLDKYNRDFIEEHYPSLKLLGFNNIAIQLKLQLNDTSLTDSEKQVIQEKLYKINQVQNWINSAMQTFYKYEALINQATTSDAVDDLVNQAFNEYDQIAMQDPKITFAEVS